MRQLYVKLLVINSKCKQRILCINVFAENSYQLNKKLLLINCFAFKKDLCFAIVAENWGQKNF